MNILHLLSTGDTGGIEVLCKEIFLKSKHNNFFCFTYRGGQIEQEMQELGAQINIFDNIKKIHINKVLKASEKIVIENNIDKIIIHHSSPISWIIAYYLNKKYYIPFYIYVHGNLADELRLKKQKLSFLRKYVYRITCKKSEGIIAISNSVSRSIKDHLPDMDNKIKVIYNGVDLNQFENLNKFHELRTTPTIIFVGRLTRDKGVHLLVEAISRLELDVKCLIIGDGIEKNKLEELSISLGIDDKIEFLGIKRNIPEWFQKADLFVHPAIWEEGFGITIVEAMASGLPCITFNKGAIPEIIEDSISGFIVKEDTVDKLANEINKAINIMNTKPTRWNEIKNAAMFRSKNFDIMHMIKQLDELLEGCGY